MHERLRHSNGLNIAVALASEAKPVIDFYQLKKQQVAGTNWFVGQLPEQPDVPINLVVAGIGACAMSNALGWLAATTRERRCVWLNIGSAGHQQREIGDIVRVACATAEGDQRSYFVPLNVPWSGELETVLSVNSPLTDYPADVVLDMEAYWFFTTATRYASAELVQSLKMISDNQARDFSQLTAARISQLIAEKMTSIDEFCQALIGSAMSALPQIESLPLEQVIGSLHFTVAQKMQVQELLVQVASLRIDRASILPMLTSLDSAGKVISTLRQIVLQTAPQLNSNAEPGKARSGDS